MLVLLSSLRKRPLRYHRPGDLRGCCCCLGAPLLNPLLPPLKKLLIAPPPPPEPPEPPLPLNLLPLMLGPPASKAMRPRGGKSDMEGNKAMVEEDKRKKNVYELHRMKARQENGDDRLG